MLWIVYPATIPLFDRLSEYLSMQATRINILATIHTACALAKKILNNYFQKTNDFEIYQISMDTSLIYFMLLQDYLHHATTVLRPQHKLQYFWQMQ